jgi:hypothetical protein
VSGFDGSVTGKGHEKWSHVDGYQHTIRGAEIGDTRFGRVEHEPLAVLKRLDRVLLWQQPERTPDLRRTAAAETHLDRYHSTTSTI